MNAGLSNLSTLKARLLPSTWTDTTAQDAAITALGLGVAGCFETYTGRKFLRTAGATEKFPSNSEMLQLTRIPVETFTALALQSELSGTWEDITSAVLRCGDSGVVTLSSTQDVTGNSTLRATYTGGYWWDTTEDDSGTLPTGATAIPATLQTAWFIQCKALWARTETDAVKAGLDSGNLGALSALINEAELLPVVRQMLQPFRILAA